MAVIPKLDWRGIVHLYALTLLTVTGFFLLGLYVGRSFPVEAEPARFTAPSGGGSSGSQSNPQLEFYGRLNEPATRRADGAGAEPSPLPQPGSRDAGALGDVQAAPSDGSLYTVQIAAMEHEQAARRIMTRARSRDYPAVMHRPGPNNPFYLVWVGEFSTDTEAYRWARRLYDDGFNTYVRSVSKSP